MRLTKIRRQTRISSERLPTVGRSSFGPKLALATAALLAAIGVAAGLADSMSAYLAVAVGGALGGVGGFWCSGIAARLVGETFPWDTLLVNVVGPDGRILGSTTARQFVMIGICGGYTTFSSFSLQTLNLMNDGECLHATAKIFGWIFILLSRGVGGTCYCGQHWCLLSGKSRHPR